MRTHKLLAVTVAATLVAACTTSGPYGRPNPGVMSGGGINKQDIGTVAGGVAGGVIGHNIGGGTGQTIATIAGVGLGALLGNQIGSSLDKADMAAYNQTAQRALETAQPGQALPWTGQNASGVVIPSNYYQTQSGQYCREYTSKVNVGGRTQEAYGTACRQPDGTWQIVSQ